MNADKIYRDSDAENPEVYRMRHERFAEECDRFEREFGMTIDYELDGLISAEQLTNIKSGEIDVIPALSQNDLWAELIGLHMDLRYVLWGKRQTA